MRVSIRFPKATRMVAQLSGMPARMTRDNATSRSFTNPQIFGNAYERLKPSIHEIITPDASQSESTEVVNSTPTERPELPRRYACAVEVPAGRILVRASEISREKACVFLRAARTDPRTSKVGKNVRIDE